MDHPRRFTRLAKPISGEHAGRPRTESDQRSAGRRRARCGARETRFASVGPDGRTKGRTQRRRRFRKHLLSSFQPTPPSRSGPTWRRNCQQYYPLFRKKTCRHRRAGRHTRMTSFRRAIARISGFGDARRQPWSRAPCVYRECGSSSAIVGMARGAPI